MQVGWARQKMAILDQYLAFVSMTGEVRSTIHGRQCSSRSHLVCLFTAQTATHQWILFITAPPAWTTTPKRTEHNLIVCIGKSEVEVTNNRRPRLIVLLKVIRQRRSIARPLYDSRATCLHQYQTILLRDRSIKM